MTINRDIILIGSALTISTSIAVYLFLFYKQSREKKISSITENINKLNNETVPKINNEIKSEKHDQSYNESSNNKNLLNYQQVKVLISSLSSDNLEVQLSTLKTIINSSAFIHNQNIFRDYGCIAKLISIVKTNEIMLHIEGRVKNEDILAQTLLAINNLLINADNQPLFNSIVPSLKKFIFSIDSVSTKIKLLCLKVLINMSATDQNHESLINLMPFLLNSLSLIENKVISISSDNSTNSKSENFSDSFTLKNLKNQFSIDLQKFTPIKQTDTAFDIKDDHISNDSKLFKNTYSEYPEPFFNSSKQFNVEHIKIFKLSCLQILVNFSTNPLICDNLLDFHDVNMDHLIFPFSIMEEDLQLRWLTLLRNLVKHHLIDRNLLYTLSKNCESNSLVNNIIQANIQPDHQINLIEKRIENN